MSSVLRDTTPLPNNPRFLGQVSGIWRGVLGFCAFLMAFYFAYRLGMAFNHATAAPFWFPDSVLLCTLLLVRPRWWGLFLVATLPIRLLVAVPSDAPYGFLLSAFAIDSAKAVMAATLLRRFSSDPIRFETTRDFGLYCGLVVLLIPAIAASFGAAARLTLGRDYWASWEQWFFGDALASLILTPFIFYWILRFSHLPRQPYRRLRVEPILLTCGLVGSSLLILVPPSNAPMVDARFFATVPFLLWAALRFGMLGASGAVTFLTFFSVAASLFGHGPFAVQAPPDMTARLQYFLMLRAAPLYLIAVLIEHKQLVERSLRDSEQRFRQMADTAPVLIWTSTTDGLCDFFNKGWLDFTGRTLEQEQGANWTAGIHRDDLQHCLTVYESHFDARQPFEMDYRLRRHDGEYRWILDKGVPRYNSRDEFLGYIGTAIDITDRRIQAAALSESEERYREVVECQTDFVCRFLPDMTLTFVNKAYCDSLKRTREELLGTKLPVLQLESVRANIAERTQDTNTRHEPSVWECEAMLPDGSIGWQHWTCYRILSSDGALTEFQMIGHDITKRKQADEVNRKLQHTARLASLGELTAMIAHEIQQPLTAILSNAEAGQSLMQLERPPFDEIRQIFSDICKDNLRADEAIRKIRSLMQKRNMQLLPLDLNKTVAAVLGLVAGDALQRRVKIRSILAVALPSAHADGAYIEQVLINLISNGMDAMEDTAESKRELVIETKQNGPDGLEVVVSDSGHGIPQDKMPHVFDSFFTTKENGTGLGLSIARSIIQAHQGRIWAQNREDDAGAAFHFSLRTAACALALHTE